MGLLTQASRALAMLFFKTSLCLAVLAQAIVCFGLRQAAEDKEAAQDIDPYHVIQVHWEEGSADPLATRREWEDAKAEKKRVALLVEKSQRAASKLDATMAAQQVQVARIADLSSQLRRLRWSA